MNNAIKLPVHQPVKAYHDKGVPTTKNMNNTYKRNNIKIKKNAGF